LEGLWLTGIFKSFKVNVIFIFAKENAESTLEIHIVVSYYNPAFEFF